MGQFRVTTREVTLTAAGGAATTLRVWDAPTGSPLNDMEIFITSRGIVTAAGNLTWNLYWGGNWSGGTPFATTSTHAGGALIAGPVVIAGGVEIAQRINAYAGFIPPNLPAANGSLGGFPIVVELINAKAAPVTVWVSFVSRTISDM